MYDADGYLDGLEIRKADYRDIINEFKQMPDTVFFIDPPYLSTQTDAYKSGNYWRLTDYLDVIALLKDLNYIYFTSNKSEITELMTWMEAETAYNSPFSGADFKNVRSSINGSCSGYEDIMICKIPEESAQQVLFP